MPRNAQIRLRLTDEEKADIEARAKAQGQKPAEFVRDLALYGQRPGEGLTDWIREESTQTLAEKWLEAGK